MLLVFMFVAIFSGYYGCASLVCLSFKTHCSEWYSLCIVFTL